MALPALQANVNAKEAAKDCTGLGHVGFLLNLTSVDLKIIPIILPHLPDCHDLTQLDPTHTGGCCCWRLTLFCPCHHFPEVQNSSGLEAGWKK